MMMMDTSSSSEVITRLSFGVKKKNLWQERDDFGEEDVSERHTYESTDDTCPNPECNSAELEVDFKQGYYVCTNCGSIPPRRVFEDDVIQNARGAYKQDILAAFFAQHPETKNSAEQMSSSVPPELRSVQKAADGVQKQLTEAFQAIVSRRVEGIVQKLVEQTHMATAVVASEAHALAMQFIRLLESQRVKQRHTDIETKEAEISMVVQISCRVCLKEPPLTGYYPTKLGCGCYLCQDCSPAAAPVQQKWKDLKPLKHDCLEDKKKVDFNEARYLATSRPTVTAFSAIAAACIILVGEKYHAVPRAQALCKAASYHYKTLSKDNLHSWVRRIRVLLKLHPEPDLPQHIAAMANWYSGMFPGKDHNEDSDNRLLVWYLLHPQQPPQPKWLKPLTAPPTVEDVDGRLTSVLLHLRLVYDQQQDPPRYTAAVPQKKSAWIVAAVVAYLRMRLRTQDSKVHGDIDKLTTRMGVTTARFQACKAELVQLI